MFPVTLMCLSQKDWVSENVRVPVVVKSPTEWKSFNLLAFKFQIKLSGLKNNFYKNIDGFNLFFKLVRIFSE